MKLWRLLAAKNIRGSKQGVGYSDGTCWRAAGERIWTDGQCATIAAAILIIAQDAPRGIRI